MPKTTWIFASILSVLFLVGFLGLQLYERGQELRDAQADATQSRQFAEGAMHTNATLAADVLAARAQIESLEERVREATESQAGLEKQLRAELESKDVTISELQGRLTVNILDRVLFDSGEATLKPEGETILKKVAEVLSQFPNRPIQVIGHTDNVPIRGVTRSGFSDNWELSAGRAVAAVRFLQTHGGVDPRRLSAVGYGEFHPLSENTTPEGRARNRRIAVVVSPEEVAPSDVPRSRGGTNQPLVNAEAPHSNTNTNASPAVPPPPTVPIPTNSPAPAPNPTPVPTPSPTTIHTPTPPSAVSTNHPPVIRVSPTPISNSPAGRKAAEN